MDYWSYESRYSPIYYIAGIRDVSFGLLPLFPLCFLIRIQRLRPNIYDVYKGSIFLVCYTYYISMLPKFLADIHHIIFSLEEETVSVLYCTIVKSYIMHFEYHYECFILALCARRYLLIVHRYQMSNYLFVSLFFVLCLRHNVSLVIWGFNILTAAINLHLLHYTTSHIKQRGVRLGRNSAEQRRDQRTVMLGLLAQSIIPVLSNGLTLMQINLTLYSDVDMPLWLFNTITFTARTNSFWRITLPFIFVRPFQNELKRIFGLKSEMVTVVRKASKSTACNGFQPSRANV